MKQLKSFLALGCIVAMSLTSCLKDSNDETQGLTPTEKAQCMNAVRGEYSGALVYAASSKDPKNPYDNADTISIDWSVDKFDTDTLLVLRSFPAQVVAEHIIDSDLKASLMEQNPKTDLKCQVGFYKIEQQIQFYLGPQKLEYNVFFQDATHKLTVIFWYNAYSSGYKDVSKNTMEGRLIMASAYLDEQENNNYFSSLEAYAEIPMVFSTIIEAPKQSE